MRVVFAGSPDAARRVLGACLEAGVPIVGVVSQPDRPVGRKKVVTPTPVSAFAVDHQLPLERPNTATELAEALTRLTPDLVIAVAYGRLITADVLAMPKNGWWNVHFSLLPAHRGATPVQHTLLAGETTTGVSVFQIDEGLDTGPILAQHSVPVRPGVTAGELLEQLAELGAKLLIGTVDDLRRGELDSWEQTGEATLAPKLPRDAGRLNCFLPAPEVFWRFQATTPEPGAYVPLGEAGSRLGIIEARVLATAGVTPGVIDSLDDSVVLGCAQGAIELLVVHPAGKKVMTASQWWRGVGHPVRCGH